jgi:hypothetical protein
VERIKILLQDGMDEKRLMLALTWAIDGVQYHDQLPCRKDGSGGLWQLDGHNDWFAKLTRKGETLHIGEPPAEDDTLEVWHRYWREPLEAIKPWLEYRFSPRGMPLRRQA